MRPALLRLPGDVADLVQLAFEQTVSDAGLQALVDACLQPVEPLDVLLAVQPVPTLGTHRSDEIVRPLPVPKRCHRYACHVADSRDRVHADSGFAFHGDPSEGTTGLSGKHTST